MPQTPDKVLEALKNNQYSPVYFLHGEEPYYIDAIAEYIEQHALTDTERGFNQTVMYGKEVNMRNILESARRFPMMAQRQVILVKEAQEIQDINRKEVQANLGNYCKSPVPSTVLVFAYKHKKLDGRTELAKTLDKYAILVDSKKIYENKVPDWIKQYCKDKKHKITEKAVKMLTEYIGNDLARTANEIDKMLLNYEGQVEIDDSMVAKHVGISKEYNIFELQTAIAKKDVFKANRIIKYFEKNPRNNPIIPIISLLYAYFSKVLLVHHNRSLDKHALAKAINVNPYFLQEYITASQNYSLHKTILIVNYLHQADLQSKGVNSLASESHILKELIYRILH
ncbi:DNA polymerase III subunit delta [Rapidithrix thailandica]|uniref:DNA polymerase III subunit delta n=1 Tax=Rapidithrix thailandica TaxID=413964 RepID=A0AAW9S8Y8_9BACT